MITGTDIDRAREIEDGAAIDALMDDKSLLPFQLVDDEPDIFELADALADLRDTYRLPHLISYRGNASESCIHVDAEWFEAEFAGNPNVTIEPHPQQCGVKKIINYEGVEIFCWLDAKFEMVAA